MMTETVYPWQGDQKELLNAGQWLRRQFRREYGRGIATRWFN